LLSVILTYTGFALEQLHESDPLCEDVRQVQEAGQRAAALTKQLLAFSRRQILEPRITDLNTVIRGLEGMLRRLLGEDIDIRVNTAPDLGSIMADPGQLEQVIMNLVVNARDAMPEGGKLTIETCEVDVGDEYVADHVGVKAGRYVCLCVSDTGVGIDPDTQHRIFEPFFTTKDKASGTGLGLSTVYGIVKQSGGNVTVYSELGRGTTFRVYLPRLEARALDDEQGEPRALPTGSETILIVEDDQGVRRAAERILQRAGYRVLGAASGRQALALCADEASDIDLLLVDIVLPQMGGRELALRLKQYNPRIKVVFTSGYPDDAIVHHGVLRRGTHFIAKPFSAARLTRKVREALDEDS
jgi:CheY-like chemotaxis protein